MFAETLTTPHPNNHCTDQPQPLLEAAEVDDIRAELQSTRAETPELYNEAKLRAAAHIGQAVRRTLWFPTRNSKRDDFEEMGIPPTLPLETIAEQQVTSCFGFAIVNSECLEAAEIDHYVGYVNGHANLVVPTSPGAGEKELHLFDSLSPKFNQEISRAISRGNAQTIEDQTRQYGRAAVMLDTISLMQPLDEDLQQLVEEHPWLIFEKGNKQVTMADNYIGMSNSSRTRWRSRYQLAMSLFPPENGRQALQSYITFRHALHTQEPYEAFRNLQSMAGAFPEIDARQSHDSIRKLIKMLCGVDRPDLAEEAVQQYFDSFRLSRDSRIPEAMGDCLRLVARHDNAPEEVTDKAERAYKNALARPHAFREALEKKIGKLLAMKSAEPNLDSTTRL